MADDNIGHPPLSKKCSRLEKICCRSHGPAAQESCWSTTKAVGSHTRLNIVIHKDHVFQILWNEYGGEFTVMNCVTSDYTLIIQWCSRWRYIMTSPVMTRMVTSFKE